MGEQWLERFADFRVLCSMMITGVILLRRPAAQMHTCASNLAKIKLRPMMHVRCTEECYVEVLKFESSAPFVPVEN